MAIISPVFWNRDYGAGFSFLYLLTTQMLGYHMASGPSHVPFANVLYRFGLAGLARRWLVYPGALIWPLTLASTVLFRALHEPQDRTPANGWVMTRYKFFAYFTIFAFVIFWFPDFIWTSLSAFAFITWLVPHNQKVNAIFGVSRKDICPRSLIAVS